MTVEAGKARYGLIGYPVSHSMSPDIFGAAFEALGIRASYHLFPIPPDRLLSRLESLESEGVRGVNVTVPHKTAVIRVLDELDETARLAGAVNTVVFGETGKTGHNTDVEGFADSLDAQGGPEVKGRKILVLGAGGAARAVVVSLARRSPSRIAIANRDRAETQRLISSVQGHFRGVRFETAELRPEEIKAAAEDSVLCVQATSLGLRPGDPLPADPGLMPPTCFFFDLVYGPDDTPFVRAARGLGFRAVDGKEMLLRQAARSFSIWLGREAPLDAMRLAMNRKITGVPG